MTYHRIWSESATTLERLLGAVSGAFSNEEITEVRTFLDASEYGLALETLVGIILDENKYVPPDVPAEIRRLADLMGLDGLPEEELQRHVR